jgi:hypothetical protein
LCQATWVRATPALLALTADAGAFVALRGQRGSVTGSIRAGVQPTAPWR